MKGLVQKSEQVEVVVDQQQLFSVSLIDSFSVVFLRKENWCTTLQLGHLGNYPRSISPQLLKLQREIWILESPF